MISEHMRQMMLAEHRRQQMAKDHEALHEHQVEKHTERVQLDEAARAVLHAAGHLADDETIEREIIDVINSGGFSQFVAGPQRIVRRK